MIVIPAIDIINGKCVRLTQGDYTQQKTYSDNPLDIARRFEDAGIKHLHLVDLDGAKGGSIVNFAVLEKIVSGTALKIDFGGGIKSDADIELAFNCGANQVTAGSIAVKDRGKVKTWIKRYGPRKIILGADVRNKVIAVNGWLESGDNDVFEFIQAYLPDGIEHVICTDIAMDGMLNGPSFELYRDLMSRFPSLRLIASGGVSSVNDLHQLEEMGLYGAIVGKAFYEGKISLHDLKSFA